MNNQPTPTDQVDFLLSFMYAARQKDKRTNAEIERAACVVQGTLKRIRKGKAAPRLDTVLKLLDQFNYTLSAVKTKRGAILSKGDKNA